MGVKGLDSVIKEIAAGCIQKTEFSSYNGTIQSVDAAINLYKFCIAIIGSDNFRTGTGEVIGHLTACFYRSISMLFNGIFPLWIFDGVPPGIKQSTLNTRKRKKDVATSKLSDDELKHNDRIKLNKKAFTLTSRHIRETKELLKMMGLPYIEAPGEAEAQCVAFEMAGISDGVVTEDWDALLFGCKKLLKDFSGKSNVTEINVDELMRLLGMSKTQLIDFGGILSNDYCSGISGLKPIDAYNKFKECGFVIEKLIIMLKNENMESGRYKYRIPHNLIEQMQKSREYYMHAPVIDPNETKIVWEEPKYKKIYSYLVDKKKFDPVIITNKLNELKKIYQSFSGNNSVIKKKKMEKEIVEEKSDYLIGLELLNVCVND